MNVTLNTSDGFQFVLVLLALAFVVYFFYVYRTESKNALKLSTQKKVLLWSFRAFVGIMVLMALSKPSMTRQDVTTRPPVMAFLLDQSASMLFPSEPGNPLVKNAPKKNQTRYLAAVNAIETIQNDLSKTHDMRIYGFSDATKLLKVLTVEDNEKNQFQKDQIFGDMQVDGQYSNVGDGLLDTLREMSANQISGIVLLSDGRQTGGEDLKKVMKTAAENGIAVHTVSMGTEFPLSDLSIDDVIAPADASLGDLLVFNLKITNQISSSLETTLSVFEEGVEILKRGVTLKRGENTVPITVIPEVEGTRKFEFKLPTFPDVEVNLKNNENVTHVEIVKRSLRIILVSGRPSLEYYYLVPALLRDPIVELSCFLQVADVDYVHQGNNNIKEIPQTSADWQNFDVCILMDVDPTGITPPQINGLEGMVNKGGGLLVIAGRTNGLGKLIQVHGAKVRSMLPVEVDPNYLPNHDQLFTKPIKLARTSQGRVHPILLASVDAKLNQTIWSEFPDFYWIHPVNTVKSGAVSLLEEDGKGRSGAVMAMHRYGEGAVFYSGISDLWRWRYPHESYDYDRFWVRTIRYLGETKLLGGQQNVMLTSDAKVYNPGETVRLSLTITDFALLTQLKNQQIHVKVETPDKEASMILMRPDPKLENVYNGEYVPRTVGSILAEAKQAAPGGDSQAKPLFEVKHSFKVERVSLEDRDTSSDLEAMELLAETTGGISINYKNMSSLNTIAQAIPKEPQKLVKDLTEEVWDSTSFLLLFLVLICFEWCLRKWWGLL